MMARSIAVEAVGDAEHPDVVLFTRRPAERQAVNALIKEAGLSPLHYVRQVIDVDDDPGARAPARPTTGR